MIGEWIAISEWARCVEMARPGIVFEMRNAEGLVLTTECTPSLPEVPFDWTLPPIEFRAVTLMPPTHSTPLPPAA